MWTLEHQKYAEEIDKFVAEMRQLCIGKDLYTVMSGLVAIFQEQREYSDPILYENALLRMEQAITRMRDLTNNPL